MSAILGHQGGWDEILIVAVPLVLFAVLLLVAARRARDEAAGERDGAEAQPAADDHLRDA